MKRAILVLAAVACSLLMVSTATAVPVAEKKALERASNGLEKLLELLKDIVKLICAFPTICLGFFNGFADAFVNASRGFAMSFFSMLEALFKLDLTNATAGLIGAIWCFIALVPISIGALSSPLLALLTEIGIIVNEILELLSEIRPSA